MTAIKWVRTEDGVLSGEKGQVQFQIRPGESRSGLWRRIPIATRAGPAISRWGFVGDYADEAAAKAAAEVF